MTLDATDEQLLQLAREFYDDGWPFHIIDERLQVRAGWSSFAVVTSFLEESAALSQRRALH